MYAIALSKLCTINIINTLHIKSVLLRSVDNNAIALQPKQQNTLEYSIYKCGIIHKYETKRMKYQRNAKYMKTVGTGKSDQHIQDIMRRRAILPGQAIQPGYIFVACPH